MRRLAFAAFVLVVLSATVWMFEPLVRGRQGALTYGELFMVGVAASGLLAYFLGCALPDWLHRRTHEAVSGRPVPPYVDKHLCSSGRGRSWMVSEPLRKSSERSGDSGSTRGVPE